MKEEPKICDRLKARETYRQTRILEKEGQKRRDEPKILRKMKLFLWTDPKMKCASCHQYGHLAGACPRILRRVSLAESAIMFIASSTEHQVERLKRQEERNQKQVQVHGRMSAYYPPDTDSVTLDGSISRVAGGMGKYPGGAR